MGRHLLLVLSAGFAVLLLPALAYSALDPAALQGATQASLAPARPAPAPVGAASRVPILMYHAIAAPAPGAGYQSLWVRPSEFGAEIAWLHRAGFHAVTLQQWWDSWHGGSPLPTRPVVISLDDGFANWYTNALPILRRYHWPADIELIVDHNNARNVTSRMLSTLVRRDGWELDSHTITHPHLDTVSTRHLRREVAGSRRDFQRLGYTVNFFCYPFGQYDQRVLAAVKAAGYLGATTVEPGVASSADPRFELPRISVPGGLGVSGLQAKFRRFGLL